MTTETLAAPSGITVKPITRVFEYKGQQLPDPNPALSASEAQQILAQTHPDIATAKLEGPEIEGNVHTFNIVRAAGTKG